MIKYKGTFLKNFPIRPLMTPIIPHEIICQTLQIPMPRIIFDKKVVNIASITAAPGPRISPQVIMIAVTGWTFGMNTNKDLPTTASAANNASNVILYIFTQLIPRLVNQN